MHKITFILSFTTLISVTSVSQDAKKEAKQIETKIEAFASKTGIITKFVDNKLPDIKLLFGGIVETKVRKVSNGNESRFFYQISNEAKYVTNTASIEYSDLLEVIKALKSLKLEVAKDEGSNPDYMENKFITVDGFQIGYYVSKGKSSWFMKLEKYGTENTVFIKDPEGIETAFVNAKEKIEDLRKL